MPRTMAIVEEKRSAPLPITNSDPEIKIRSVLPIFGVINMTISCATTIYRAYINGDIPMIVFIVYVFFGTFLVDYWFRLYSTLSPSEHSLGTPLPENRHMGLGKLHHVGSSLTNSRLF
ncbi:uncharacterized protein LOC129304618 [Prosopis cineraria]|uniref:uncharacterized protein LOC129304618 n=1 Tax=Prosopis cineraria TaxID=364024 RepID=UPI002410584D|nr:uncharacterized protein LOC129304618 [Prosopis cineraria]